MTSLPGCPRCAAPRQDEITNAPAYAFCPRCAVAFLATITDLYIDRRQSQAAIHYIHVPADRQHPQWRDYRTEGLGLLVTPDQARAGRAPYLHLEHEPPHPSVYLEVWEYRAYYQDSTIYAYDRWRPAGYLPRGIEGWPRAEMQVTAARTAELERAFDGLNLLADPEQRRITRGRPRGSISLDPAERAAIMPYIDAWEREGCTWPQIRTRLLELQDARPDLPSVSSFSNDTLQRWLKDHRRPPR